MTDKFLIHQLELPAAADGLRLDQALTGVLPQYSRAQLQRWIASGAVVFADARPVRASLRVRGGEQLSVRATARDAGGVAAQAMPLEIIYEDQGLLVIDKPAGLVVHPGAGNRDHTLQNGLLAYDPALAEVPRAGLVHRLDKDTTGLMVVARTARAHALLVAAMQARLIGREYLALCCGLVRSDGSIDEAIGRHRSARTRMAVRSDGRTARTHYQVKERFRAHTLLQLRLETGRTHQIRVHMAHLGHAVFGDPDYAAAATHALLARLADATPRTRAVLAAFRRQALHAERLRFAHPDTGRMLQFRAPLPADFRLLLSVLRRDRQRAAAAEER